MYHPLVDHIPSCTVGGCLPRGGVCIPACTEADTPPLWTEWQTGVKTLPCSNFVAGGNNGCYITVTRNPSSSTIIFVLSRHCNNVLHCHSPATAFIAGGNRANTIHYISNNSIVGDGEMVLMDSGCEYHGYTSDITRTWPISGKRACALWDGFILAQFGGWEVGLPWTKYHIYLRNIGKI